MKNHHQIQRALDILNHDPVKLAALFSCSLMGMTTQGQVKSYLTEEEATNRSIYRKLKWLSEPPAVHNFPPLLVGEDIALAGSNGRPEKVYLLTEFGAAVLTALDPEHPVTAPRIRDQADLAHRYIILKVAEKVKENNLRVQIEHRLKNLAQEIRADIYIEIDEILLIVEVEQKLLRRNLKRAREKLIRLAKFVQAEKSTERWQVQLVFNVRPRELPTVARYWREAFTDAQQEFGELPYDLYYMTASNLLDDASFSNALFNAELLYDREFRAVEPDEEESDEKIPEAGRPNDISDDKYQRFQEALDNLFEAPPARSLAALTELASLIYNASYYENSPTLKAAVFPWASIWLMRRYLDDPRMGTVKKELTQNLTRIHKRNPGMVMLRDRITSLLWDVLLFHHGLGRGGMLHVVFQVPDFQDRSSDFRVEVRINDDIRQTLTKKAKALSWFFTSIYLYRQHLGLVTSKKK